MNFSDENVGRYIPDFADDDENDVTPPAPPAPLAGFDDDDDFAPTLAPSAPTPPSFIEAGDSDEDAELASQAPSGPIPTAEPVTSAAPEYGEVDSAQPQNHLPPQTVETPDESADIADRRVPQAADTQLVPGDNVDSPNVVAPTEIVALSDPQAPVPEDASSQDDDTDVVGDLDSFVEGLDDTAGSVPSPRGLPSIDGMSISQIRDVNDFLGVEELPKPIPARSGALWARADVALPDDDDEGHEEYEPEPTYETAGRQYDPVVDELATGAPAPASPGGYVDYPDSPDYVSDRQYVAPDYVTAESDDQTVAPGDYQDYEDQNYEEYGYEDQGYDVEEYADPADDGLDPDALVADTPVAPLRERSREKKDGTSKKKNGSRKKKDKADAKLAKEDGGTSKGRTSKKKIIGIGIGILVVLFGANTLNNMNKAKDDPEPEAAPPASAAADPSTPSAPTSTTAEAPSCMTATEVVGTPVECAEPGDQRTGTNAILAYEQAFYTDRDSDRVYSLTSRSSEGGPDAEAAKRGLKDAINGTPCGSTYIAKVTPREIGKLYEVTIKVTSPAGDPMPSADGTCASGTEVSSSPGKTRTLVQDVVVEGAPGSYVVRSITRRM